jgi:hypothetical protein
MPTMLGPGPAHQKTALQAFWKAFGKLVLLKAGFHQRAACRISCAALRTLSLYSA